MMLRHAIAAACLFGAAAAELPPVPLNGDWRDVAIAAKAHQLRGDAEPEEPLQIGALIYRGGIALSSDDPAFGGFSGLEIDEDGERILAISDRGQWLEASLSYSADGRLAGAFGGRMSAITDKDGVVLAGPIADAEGLARADDDSLIVSFEREARIDRYRIKRGMIVFDAALATLADGPDAPAYNKGVEAIATLPGGFIALAESALPSGAAGFRFDGAGREPLRYAPARDFSVTDAETRGDDLFILERAFSRLTGVRSRILRAQLPDETGAISGELLASFGPLYAIDNFEGIAARHDDGRRLLYIISDDNHSARQKTLLLMFEVTE